MAIIDAEDYDLCKNHKWYLDSGGYARTKINGVKIRLHRFIMNPKKNELVDHINRDRLDCRKENMRIVTRKENSINRGLQSNNKSGVSGVYFYDGYWIAKLQRESLEVYGYFKTKEEAINQRLLWEIQYFGEYAPQANTGGMQYESNII